MSAAPTPAMRTQVEAALALRAAGRLEDALDVLTTPAEYSSDFYIIRGEIQLELGRFQESAGSYFTVVSAEPDNVFAQFNFGACLQQLGRWTEAAQAFQGVLQVDPHRDDARLALGACMLHQDRPEAALGCFDQCWSDAARSQALFGKAVALQLLQRFEEAEAGYKRLLKSDPNSVEIISNLIALNFEIGDSDAAARYARRLLEISPQSLTALQALAAVALVRRDYEAAVHYCDRIVEIAPDCVEAWHNLRFASGRVVSALKSSGAAPPATGRK